jgi:hypothetical protein
MNQHRSSSGNRIGNFVGGYGGSGYAGVGTSSRNSFDCCWSVYCCFAVRAAIVRFHYYMITNVLQATENGLL